MLKTSCSQLTQTETSRQRGGTAGLPSTADIYGDCRHGRSVPICMARPRGTRWTSKIDERESCINVSGLRSGAIAPGHHGYPRASETH
jgi:hypothetical protein